MDGIVSEKAVRRRRGAKRERTRAALIAAAGDLIRDQGYEAATLEAIAAKAGMTRGAIYGNFANRDDLFAEVVLDRWSPVMPEHVPETSFLEHMRRLGRAYASAARARAPVAAHSASFQLQVRRHEALRRRLAIQGREIVENTAKELLRLYPGEELPMPATPLIKALSALGEGLMAAYFADPEEYPEDVFVAAFEAFAIRKSGRS
ncbi:TetR/AcrR family transcriptional regulator [Phenylobacterium sp. LH3H17]|uniref:TetR/AcrR family transcriptional regulator n=1 Tax=Phenylobacterium sp. LH3H17 TaxID=2903901 RepID=UPI0020C9B4F4|nr:TetR/AcrR family transcriptional regulator [Phenylobacterium sp. LH3H17]UTP40904.1 TetR/AcrR family transcriptional regulator [Phenylobacterium sp. LH3H17]